MVKCTAVEGGIDLQRVDSEDGIDSAFTTVQHQGTSYFVDFGVFLERFIESARHVKIQIMGDLCGKKVAVAECDCSLQSRN